MMLLDFADFELKKTLISVLASKGANVVQNNGTL